MNHVPEALMRDRFAAGIAVANIPTLLMVVAQLTGEERWLQPPYRPSRSVGLGDNDTGGLPEAIQEEIRAAALEAILAWRAGRPVAIPDPSPGQLVEMLSVAMGEPVPEEYGEFTRDLFGHRPPSTERIPVPEGFRVLVIGAGVSGLCAAVNLKAAGIPFTVLEKNPVAGGVWQENRYPGAGVDTPNHLYSFSFARYDWPTYYALRDDLHAYLQHVAREFDLAPHIRCSTRVETARYDAESQAWLVTVTRPDGSAEILRGNVLISAAGIFNPPVWPRIPGLSSFAGPCFHTAEWPDGIDLAGKHVAIIGNGASCMQVGPEIQHAVESLTIFQRSPHWAAPFPQFRRSVPEALRFLIQEVPLYQAWYRVRLGWTINDRVHATLQKDPAWPYPERSLNATNDAHRAYYTRYIQEQLGDRQDLLPKVLPDYPPFGKRMLMDNGWYRMLQNPRVQLVDTRITEVDEGHVVTADGTRHKADVLMIATGFDVLNFLNTYEIFGRDARKLRDFWEGDNAAAYLGTVVPGFPNFFMMYGPNLQPGHGGSFMVVAEMQMRYIMDMLRRMTKEGIGAVDCRTEVFEAYRAGVDAAHANMVWAHEGMTTYYRNSRGRIVVNSPYRNVDFHRMTREARLADYHVEARATQREIEHA
ncbi:MAG: NAD(P)/FAD-dependent oxidoreductase [Gammaproteobacteria bacterium]|nr:NAD(P)/FAD-dependent oxidoreductase [Gammaproteobacteria bacterium]